MWTETLGYRDHRQPYIERFFAGVAEAIPLTGREDLLDLGAGVGEVALRFASFVASLTAVDAEQPMLDELAKRAQAAGVGIRLIHAKVEEAPLDLGRFPFITIGNAHWHMHAPGTFTRLEQWLAPGGRILVCAPHNNPDGQEWPRVFRTTREKWAKRSLDFNKLSMEQFVQGTVFQPVKQIVARGQRTLELDDLLQRALGYSTTSPAVLGEVEAAAMMAELRTVMTPYFRDGPIVERLATRGILFRRRGDS
jgi:ubiquinone/menaquinone biosynthesis C-methylase UbiE